LDEDFSQANDLAASMPEKLAALKQEFMALAEQNQDFPIGAGNWLRLHPEDRIKTSYTEWNFTRATRRMPEFTAPGLGRQSNRVTIEVEVPEHCNGVLYAVGGSSGGVTLYMQDGQLVYLYNMLILEQYEARSTAPIAAGKHRIEVVTQSAGPGKAGTATLFVDGVEVGSAELKRTVPAAFTASESFDVGADLGSTVSLDYAERRPFEFEGKIQSMRVQLK
jgi:arylsulfatase